MTYQPFPAFRDWPVDFDPSVVDAYAKRLQQAKATATPEALRRAVEIATRYAAVDTNAIEGLYATDRGFTRTIATQSEFWQRALDLRGEQVKRSIGDALAGYDYVLDAATGATPITATWIRELHAVITEHQETFTVYVPIANDFVQEERLLPRGEYKRLPNNPTNIATGQVHDYALPEDTPSEMIRLTDELNSPEFLRAHPVVQAAYAHFAFVSIHPFADGNGRVSRALASAFLYRDPGVPLVVFVDQRDAYLDLLGRADAGQPGGFVHFIEQRVIDTIDMVAESLGESETGENDGADTAAIVKALSDWPDQDLVAVARRLHGLCVTALQDALTTVSLPDALDVQIIPMRPVGIRVPRIPEGYVLAGSFAWMSVTAIVDPSSGQRHWQSHVIAVATHAAGNAPELLVVGLDDGPLLDVWRRNIDPVETAALTIQINTWAENTARRFIRSLRTVLGERHP